ncbi:cell division protein FtsA [Candidatus Saccharibacteria bacterium]|nr:MAG: cell division protein FtsA [Candidatus Saccharibacteria bacterium]
MNEHSRFAVGIDVGTTTVRCVVGHIDESTGVPTVVGVGEAANSGMRKGVVSNLNGPARAIDDALGEAERMSGYEINEATISVNGAHIVSTKTDGMIAAGAVDHEISASDVSRVEEVATIGKIPANREVIDVIAHDYKLDGQDNVRDPIGMTGTRLEINAHVMSGLVPHMDNLRKTASMATVEARALVPAVVASARAVITETQLESGVAVVDMGGATTGVAVFEEGDLQYVGVVPMGGVNVTNDLAIGLKTDPEIAEQIKRKHGSAVARKERSGVSIDHDGTILTFNTEEIDEIIGARLEEIFEGVEQELKKAGRAGKLPSGIVLVGGAALMPGMKEFVRDALGLAAKLGKPSGFGGVAERAEQPDYSAAVGLMLQDSAQMIGNDQKSVRDSARGGAGKSRSLMTGISAVAKNVFNRFRS